jgi:hypothetical protein
VAGGERGEKRQQLVVGSNAREKTVLHARDGSSSVFLRGPTTGANNALVVSRCIARQWSRPKGEASRQTVIVLVQDD